MIWRPQRLKGLGMGLVLLTTLFLLDVWNLQQIIEKPINLVTFFRGLGALLSVPLLGVVGYGMYGVATLHYRVNRDGLIIRWADIRHFVPMEKIERVVWAFEMEGRKSFWGLAWPGCWIGRVIIRDLGMVRAYATAPPSRQLLVVTSEGTFGISPADVDDFLFDFQAKRNLGALHRWEQETVRSGVLAWPIWTDRCVQLLLSTALLANLALLGHICAVYPNLSPILPLHFDAQGQADRLGIRTEIFVLPAIGLLIAIVNAGLGLFLYRREKTCAYLFFGFAVLIQLLIWTATVHILA